MNSNLSRAARPVIVLAQWAATLSKSMRDKFVNIIELRRRASLVDVDNLGENGDRLATFSDTIGDSSFRGHAALHNISIGLAPLACAIEGALLCFHLFPKLYHYMQHEREDLKKERRLAAGILFSIPITMLGIGALAVGGAAVALPLGAICAAVKTIRAAYELSNSDKANITHRQETREKLFFNLFGCITLVTCMVAPPVAAVMAIVGLSMSGITIAVKSRKTIKKTGFKVAWNNFKSSIKHVFRSNRAQLQHAFPEERAAAIIHTQRQASVTEHKVVTDLDKSDKPAPHTVLDISAEHPESGGLFTPHAAAPDNATLINEDSDTGGEGEHGPATAE